MLSKKLGQICKLRQGFQVPVDRQITECKEGYVRFIRIVDYTQKTDDIRYVLDDEKFYYVKPDDIVMVRYGAAGEVGHGISGVIANNMFLIDPVMDINKDYLFYYLSQAKVKNKLLSASSSTTMPALNFKIVNDLDIPIWSRERQEDIVKHLDKIEGIISKRREELTKLDELIKARFVEMFGNLNEKVRLGDCCDVHARIGWQALTKAEHRKTGEYMLITGTDFKDGGINYSTCVYVEKERYEMDPHIILKNDDVLITKDGTIGKVAVVHNLPKPATLNAGVFVVRPDDRFNKEYISYVFRGPLFADYVEASKTGATIKHLNQKHLVEFMIPEPTMDQQIEFAGFYSQVDKSKVAVQKALDETQVLFDSLMQEYFG